MNHPSGELPATDHGAHLDAAVPTRQAHRGKHSRANRLKLGIAMMTLLVCILAALMLTWSRQPPIFDVGEQVVNELDAVDGGSPRPGVATVATAIGVGETLLDKPGGFLYNDVMPPGLLMDNMPSWECGVMMALRDLVQALRDDFSRTGTQSLEDPNVKRADLQLAIDPKSWVLPVAEEAYRESIAALRAYLAELARGGVRGGYFHARADNLADYLGLVEKRLGNFGVRLSNSIADANLRGVLPASSATGALMPESSAIDAVGRADQAAVEATPVDKVFFCSRGYSWALLHFMRAISVDFAPILQDKNAEIAVQQIIRDLNGPVKPFYSPWVLNGRGYGFLANHSLVAASYISRVNAAVIELKILLQQG